MSKELTPLEAFEKIIDMAHEPNGYQNFTNACDASYTQIVKSALKRLEDYESHTTFTMVNQINGLADENKELRKRLNIMYELRERYNLDQRKLQALKIIKECVGLKMTADGDVGCLYVPIVKCFQPLEQNIVVVGCVNGKEKIDLLKEVLLGEKQ